MVKYLVGLDVVQDGGKTAIKEIQNEDGELEIFFNLQEAIKKEKHNDPFVIEFLKYAQSGDRNENGAYEKGDVTIHLKSPESFDDIIGMTDSPINREDFYQQGIEEIERPNFLLQSPEIMTKGIIYPDVSVSSNIAKKLESKISIDDFSEHFNLENSFFNQFIVLKIDNGLEMLFQVRQDWSIDELGDTVLNGDPYVQRLEENTKFFSSDNCELEMTDYGKTTNHLHQYLAYKYLLLNPKIEESYIATQPSDQPLSIGLQRPTGKGLPGIYLDFFLNYLTSNSALPLNTVTFVHIN